MSTITIRRSHSLAKKQAVEVANQVAAELASEYGIVTTWSGNTAYVKGTGLTGELRLAPKCIEIDIELGFILTMFRSKIAAGIETEFDRLLGSKATKAKKTTKAK